MNEKIVKALNWRYAVQAFNQNKKIAKNDLKTILESARLAPSSFGLEAWKFVVVENKEVREKLKEAGYGQPKIAEASHLIVIARRTDLRENVANERIERTAKIYAADPSTLDGLRRMIEGTIAGKSDEVLNAWAIAQTYIPLGVMVETASLLGIDSAPMEGFVNEKFDEILGLKEKNLTATVLLALGYRGEDKYASMTKVRRDFADVVEFVK